ncbi:head maturation protease, ClpP-related [Methylobacterium sp. 391_Methyba4]|uniref:head maturation protease, ClpP-related n=1 Tax=Methylobacterium sp. 391_Methyba4 TaxID=3038924 RepID=UPI00241FA867|nr:head maturation protease, ClpP-related [Methylobacterium sp. 391_Methyba4]WFS07771.1 ATP-dependent Clp protease proteolytic subunit [Methylobacterium sp. 391_Methyba4]
MTVLVSGNEIVLSGTVGDLYWDECFTSSDVILALAQVGRGQDVTIRLNSGGGIATEGAAIHAAVAAHQGRKTIIVEGIAASAASVIAMAGDDVVMSPGALMMVHDPSGFTFGTVDDHEKQITALTALATAMAGIYAEKTGKPVDAVRSDMRAEIWMTPEEAVAGGYADRVLARTPAQGADPQPTAFDYRLFEHPPERLVALSDRRAWTNRARPTAATPAVSQRHVETPMANEPAAHQAATPPNPTAALAAVVDGPTTSATTVSRSDASEIAKLCVDGGVPAMAATLLAEGVTVAQAKERIGAAGEVRNLVALARRKDPTLPADLDATMLAEGKTVEQARAALFDKLVAAEEQTAISSHVPAPADAGRGSPKPVDLVADMKRRHGVKA